MRKMQLILLGFLAFILAFVFFIQCSNTHDEVKMDQNYELSKMLGVADRDLDAKLEKMGFKKNDEIELRTLSCFDGNGCYIYSGHVTIWINDDHCQDAFRINVSYTAALCLNGSLNFYNFKLDDWNPCPELQDYLEGLNDHELSAYLDKIFYKASITLEKIYVLANFPGISGLTSFFYTNQCYQWCYPLNVKNGPLEGRSGDLPAFATQINCGENCCLRSTFWYWENGKLKSYLPKFTKITGDCKMWPIGGCENGRFIGKCDHECGPL